MEKTYKEFVRDIKQLTTKVNGKTKQSGKKINETKEVLEVCRKEYRKLYNENIELKKKKLVKYYNHKNNKNKNVSTTATSKTRNKTR